ncbi:MAG TPA: DUF2119 family protein, partial [Methanosarcina sp.]
MNTDGIENSDRIESFGDSFPSKHESTETRPDSHLNFGIGIYGRGRPVRLFVAGLHGDEWKDTTGLLKRIKPPETGTLALIPFVDCGRYISTL